MFYCPSEKIFKKSRHNFVEETLLKMTCQHKHFTFSRLNISRLCSSKLVRFFKNFSEKSTFIMFCKKINTAKQSEIVLQRNSFFFCGCTYGYSFCNGIIASGKLCDCEEYILTTVFVKTREISLKKIGFLLHSIFAIFCREYIAAF